MNIVKTIAQAILAGVMALAFVSLLVVFYVAIYSVVHFR